MVLQIPDTQAVATDGSNNVRQARMALDLLDIDLTNRSDLAAQEFKFRRGLPCLLRHLLFNRDHWTEEYLAHGAEHDFLIVASDVHTLDRRLVDLVNAVLHDYVGLSSLATNHIRLRHLLYRRFRLMLRLTPRA